MTDRESAPAPGGGGGVREIEARLAATEPFAGLGAEDLGLVARHLKRRKYAAGEMIFARGDPGDFALLVEDGRIRLSIMSGDGRELSLRIAGPGTLIGEIAILDGGARSADATAMVETVALLLSRADLARLIERSPGLARAVIEMLCRRLRDTTDQLESIALHRIEARLARLFLSLVRQSDPEGAKRSVTIRLDLNQSDLADIVGASRPKVNRALVALEEAGAIRRTGPEIACRVQSLTDIAEDPEGAA
jgi:CRP/FNR family cyclic AMP-dependent transcriptional regulator